MTNVERGKRRFTQDTTCGHCNSHHEDTAHVLRDCEFARSVWRAVLPEVMLAEQSIWDFDRWWSVNLGSSRSGQLFGYVVWLFWRRRNRFIFEQVSAGVEEIKHQALFWAHLWSSSWKAHRLGREAPRIARQTQLIGWRLGGEGWFTLNTDGSLRPSSCSAAAGGLIREDQGRFVVGFASKLGSCSVVRAEIKGIIEGMCLAWERGIRKLRIQSDSASAIRLLTEASWQKHQHWGLVCQFQELKSRSWELTIEHIYREANSAADFIANSGHDLELGTLVFCSPCIEFLNWIRYDLVGVSLPRRVNNTP
ncbi:Putative ribonuclease H protein At1g65750 [Linum perenne]